MISGRNSKRVFVAANCTRTSGITIGNMASNLGAGEIIITDERGKILNTSALAKAAKAIVIHQGTGNGKAISSDIIRRKDVKQYKSAKFVQELEKRVAFGYNGSAGSIDVINANNYFINIEHKGEEAVLNVNPYICTLGYTSPTTGTTQYGVAKGLADVGVLDYQDFDNPLRFHVVTSDAGAGHLTGCEVITDSPAMTYTGGTPAVGDVLLVPGLTGTPNRDELASVYEVILVDLTNKIVTLDRAYQGANQTALAIGVIADTTVANYGVVVEGSKQSFKLGFGDYYKLDFYFEATNAGDTTITTSGTGFTMVYGNGRYEHVAVDEWMYQGYEGRNLKQGREFQNPYKVATLDHGYSSIFIDYESSERINTVETNGQPKQVQIYLDRSTYQNIKNNAAGTAFGTNIQTSTGLDTVNADSLLNVLNAFMVAAGVIVTGANSVANGGACITAGTVFNSGIDV